MLIWVQCDAGQKLQVVPNLVPSVPLFSFEDQEGFNSGLLSECSWKEKKRRIFSTGLKRPFSYPEAVPIGSCLLYSKYWFPHLCFRCLSLVVFSVSNDGMMMRWYGFRPRDAILENKRKRQFVRTATANSASHTKQWPPPQYSFRIGLAVVVVV